MKFCVFYTDSTVTPIQGQDDEAHGQVIESDSFSDLYLQEKPLDARPKSRKPRRPSARSRSKDKEPLEKESRKRANKRDDSKLTNRTCLDKFRGIRPRMYVTGLL